MEKKGDGLAQVLAAAASLLMAHPGVLETKGGASPKPKFELRGGW